MSGRGRDCVFPSLSPGTGEDARGGQGAGEGRPSSQRTPTARNATRAGAAALGETGSQRTSRHVDSPPVMPEETRLLPTKEVTPKRKKGKRKGRENSDFVSTYPKRIKLNKE